MSYRGPIFTVAAIAIFAGLIAYALIYGSGSSSNEVVNAPITTVDPSATVAGTGVGFVSPLDGATMQNPVPLALAAGGLRLVSADQPVQPGFGHMGVIIDGVIPAVGTKYVADASHLDLRDGGYAVTLPLLDPGPHTLSVFFMNSANISNGPLLGQTIHITIGSPSPS